MIVADTTDRHLPTPIRLLTLDRYTDKLV